MRLCLRYLCLDTIPTILTFSGSGSEVPLTSEKCEGLEFLPLATTNWYYHFRFASLLYQSSAIEDISIFLGSEDSVLWLMSHFAFAGPDIYQQRSLDCRDLDMLEKDSVQVSSSVE